MKKLLIISIILFLCGCGTKSLTNDDFDHLEQVSRDLAAEKPEEESLAIRAFSNLCSDTACCAPSCTKALSAVEASADALQRKAIMAAGCSAFGEANPGTSDENIDERLRYWLGANFEACLTASAKDLDSKRIETVRENLKILKFIK